jgi:hypothetical protein
MKRCIFFTIEMSRMKSCNLGLAFIRVLESFLLVCRFLNGRDWRWLFGGAALFRSWLRDDLIDGGIPDDDHIGERNLGAKTTFGIPSFHNFNFNTQNSLPEHNVSDSVVNKVTDGLSGVDHEAVGELHGFGASSAKLAGDDDLATLCARLHNESKDTIASPADSETTEEFVTERLALGDSGETTAQDLLGVELKRVLGEFESFLNQGGEFADTATLFAEDLLSVGGTNDNLGTCVCYADFTARVTLFRKFASEEFAKFSTEDTIGDKFALLADVGGGHCICSIKAGLMRYPFGRTRR